MNLVTFGQDNIPRDRLIDTIDSPYQARVTLITAPTGYGKSTVAQNWASTTTQQVAWVGLEPVDNSVERLIERITAALFPAPHQRQDFEARFAPNPDRAANVEEVCAAVSNLRHDVTLILDDIHVLQVEACFDMLNLLIATAPDNLRFMLLSRMAPPLRLGRFRVHGNVRDLDFHQLAFTEPEVGRLLAARGLTTNAHSMARMLMDDSEGWIAGIILALHASRDQSMKPQRYGSGGARYLDEYLSEEVISQLPETLQQFMLKTSVLPVLDPALCDFALETTGSAEAIQSLVLRYGFVVEQAGVVRFHHLFALVLQKMAEASLADDLFTIRHRAIIWFLDRDDADQAAELSVALGDWDLATPILRTCLRPHAERSLFALMCHWFNRIPDRVIAADAELGFWASVAWLIWGDSSRAESLLETCLPYWQSSGEPLHVGRMHVCRALLLQTRRQFAEAHTRAHQAIDILPEESKLERMYAYSLLAFTATRLGDDGDAQQATVLARACAQHLPAGEQWSPLILVPYAANAAIVRGNIHSAEAMCQMAIGQMPDYQWRAAGAIWAVLVETAIERNDLDTALDVIARYNNIPASSGDVFHFESEMTAIALLVAQSAYPEAEQRLMALRTQSGTSLPLANRERIDAQLARIWFETDRLHLVREWLRQVDLSDSHWPHVRGMGARLTQVDLALVDGEFSRAIHLLRQLIAEGTALKHWGNLVAYHARLAVAYQQLGRAKDAFESLSVALEIGIPGGFVRSFLVPRYDIIPLVRNHVAVHDSPKQCKFLLERLAHKEPPVTNGVLTAREREVMMLVAQGHSNQEIADTLFVSVNTVKNHVASINRKLVVRSRVASVARARELGIIS